jgi:hypothetical protein
MCSPSLVHRPWSTDDTLAGDAEGGAAHLAATRLHGRPAYALSLTALAHAPRTRASHTRLAHAPRTRASRLVAMPTHYVAASAHDTTASAHAPSSRVGCAGATFAHVTDLVHACRLEATRLRVYDVAAAERMNEGASKIQQVLAAMVAPACAWIPPPRFSLVVDVHGPPSSFSWI